MITRKYLFYTKEGSNRFIEPKKKNLKIYIRNQKLAHNATLSVITLNISGLNTPIKKQDWQNEFKNKNNHDPTVCCL